MLKLHLAREPLQGARTKNLPPPLPLLGNGVWQKSALQKHRAFVQANTSFCNTSAAAAAAAACLRGILAGPRRKICQFLIENRKRHKFRQVENERDTGDTIHYQLTYYYTTTLMTR